MFLCDGVFQLFFFKMQTVDCFFPVMWFDDQLIQGNKCSDTSKQPVERNEEHKLHNGPVFTLGNTNHVVVHEHEVAKY